jgi:hypothetical protein
VSTRPDAVRGVWGGGVADQGCGCGVLRWRGPDSHVGGMGGQRVKGGGCDKLRLSPLLRQQHSLQLGQLSCLAEKQQRWCGGWTFPSERGGGALVLQWQWMLACQASTLLTVFFFCCCSAVAGKQLQPWTRFGAQRIECSC